MAVLFKKLISCVTPYCIYVLRKRLCTFWLTHLCHYVYECLILVSIIETLQLESYRFCTFIIQIYTVSAALFLIGIKLIYTQSLPWFPIPVNFWSRKLYLSNSVEQVIWNDSMQSHIIFTGFRLVFITNTSSLFPVFVAYQYFLLLRCQHAANLRKERHFMGYGLISKRH